NPQAVDDELLTRGFLLFPLGRWGTRREIVHQDRPVALRPGEFQGELRLDDRQLLDLDHLLEQGRGVDRGIDALEGDGARLMVARRVGDLEAVQRRSASLKRNSFVLVMDCQNETVSFWLRPADRPVLAPEAAPVQIERRILTDRELRRQLLV